MGGKLPGFHFGCGRIGFFPPLPKKKTPNQTPRSGYPGMASPSGQLGKAFPNLTDSGILGMSPRSCWALGTRIGPGHCPQNPGICPLPDGSEGCPAAPLGIHSMSFPEHPTTPSTFQGLHGSVSRSPFYSRIPLFPDPPFFPGSPRLLPPCRVRSKRSRLNPDPEQSRIPEGWARS